MTTRAHLRKLLVALALLFILIVLVLALPIAHWRDGRSHGEPPGLAPLGHHAVQARRVWIDTDAACGRGRTTDPDDCLALLALLKAPAIHVIGISTVFGNAPAASTDRTTRELVAVLASEGFRVPPVYAGRDKPLEENRLGAETSAELALRAALTDGPLVIVALGPLTNIAAVLRAHPQLVPQVQQLLAVMGQRPGHVFHPVEGGTARLLFGHGPVFKDFNFAKDSDAVTQLLSLGSPMTLLPYEAAPALTLAGADLDDLRRSGDSGRWVSDRSQDWLSFWRDDIRQPGFFSFDLVAAAYLLHPALFRCAQMYARVSPHSWYWRWLLGQTGLFVDLQTSAVASGLGYPVIYCPSPDGAVRGAALSDAGRASLPR